jgi:hypothetical protein
MSARKITLAVAAAALAIGAKSGAQAALTLISSPLITNGPPVSSVYVFGDARDTSDLYSGIGTLGQFLFTDHPSPAAGDTVLVSPSPSAGFPIYFSLDNLTSPNIFTTGIANPSDPGNPYHAKSSSNLADFGVSIGPANAAAVPAAVSVLPGSIIYVGFEDRIGGDYDYNDLIFALNSVSNVAPEPATIAVFGIGLMGLGLVRLRKSVRSRLPK